MPLGVRLVPLGGAGGEWRSGDRRGQSEEADPDSGGEQRRAEQARRGTDEVVDAVQGALGPQVAVCPEPVHFPRPSAEQRVKDRTPGRHRCGAGPLRS
jgi:hypothetical protein